MGEIGAGVQEVYQAMPYCMLKLTASLEQRALEFLIGGSRVKQDWVRKGFQGQYRHTENGPWALLRMGHLKENPTCGMRKDTLVLRHSDCASVAIVIDQTDQIFSLPVIFILRNREVRPDRNSVSKQSNPPICIHRCFSLPKPYLFFLWLCLNHLSS